MLVAFQLGCATIKIFACEFSVVKHTAHPHNKIALNVLWIDRKIRDIFWSKFFFEQSAIEVKCLVFDPSKIVSMSGLDNCNKKVQELRNLLSEGMYANIRRRRRRKKKITRPHGIM